VRRHDRLPKTPPPTRVAIGQAARAELVRTLGPQRSCIGVSAVWTTKRGLSGDTKREKGGAVGTKGKRRRWSAPPNAALERDSARSTGQRSAFRRPGGSMAQSGQVWGFTLPPRICPAPNPDPQQAGAISEPSREGRKVFWGAQFVGPAPIRGGGGKAGTKGRGVGNHPCARTRFQASRQECPTQLGRERKNRPAVGSQ